MEGDTSGSMESVDTSSHEPESHSDDVVDSYEAETEDTQDSDGTEIHQDKEPSVRPKTKKEAPKEPTKEKSEGPKARELKEEDLDALVTVKIDGKEQKMTLRQAQARVQKGLAAEKRMQEAVEAMKKAKAYEEWASKNPEAHLKRLGIDPVQFAAQLIDQQIKWQELSESERKAIQYEKELNQYKQEKQQHLEMQRRQQMAHQQRQQQETVQKHLDNQILEAFQKSGLPQGEKFYVERMAAVMLGAVHRNEELSPAEAAAIVKRKTVSDFRRLADTMDANAIREWLGKDNLKKLLDAEVQRVTGKTAPTSKSAARPGQAPAPTKRASTKPLTEREWDAYMESLRTA